jgi:hypothetical protein
VLQFSPPVLNFGVHVQTGLTFQHQLYVTNNGPVATQINKMYLSPKDNHAGDAYNINVKLTEKVVPAGAQNMPFASVRFTGRKTGVYNQKLQISVNDTINEQEMPFRAIIQHQLLSYNITHLNFITYQDRTSDVFILNTQNQTINIENVGI